VLLGWNGYERAQSDDCGDSDGRRRHSSLEKPLRPWGHRNCRSLPSRDRWGWDMHHRPLGYERIGLLLSSLFSGTSGIVRNRK
jgi:hypothetical protein